MSSSQVKEYHQKGQVCYKRPTYREARWERSVKVYTINQESKYLLVQNIPIVNATQELLQLFALYGEIDEYRLLKDYPREQFTEVYWIKYKRIQSARFGKKKLDNRSFFGGLLHVCYAPEYETVDDVREKLNERKRLIARKCKENLRENEASAGPSTDYSSTKYSDIYTQPPPPPPPISTPALTSTPSIPPVALGHFINHGLPPPPYHIPPPPTHFKPMQHNLPFPPRYCLPTPNTRQAQKEVAISETISEYPRIPSHNATLPVEIQTLETKDVYPNQCTSLDEINTEIDEAHNKRTNKSTAKESLVNDEIKSNRKRIIWNKPEMMPSNPNHQYTSAPGAWDPFKETRLTNSVNVASGEPEVDFDISQDIRERLKKTAEASPVVTNNQNTVCPLQLTNVAKVAQPTLPKKRKLDGRKRI